MNSPCEDIKDMLVGESSLALDYASNLFLNYVPDTPDNCTTILTTPGYPPVITLGKDTELFYPSIQIIVRNRSPQIGYNLAFQIMTALHGRGPETWNQTTYLSILCTTEPYLIKWDERSRCYHSCNFTCMRRS